MMIVLKKYLTGFFLLLFILAVPFGNAGVLAEVANVFDDAGLLTDDETVSLNLKAESLQSKTGWNIFLVTTEDAGGKTAAAYADDFFDGHSPEQEDGAALLIDMDNREIYLSTGGAAIRYLTDERVESILDEAYVYVKDGNYAMCLDEMIKGIDRYYDDGIPEGQYNYDTQTGQVSVYRSLTFGETLIAFLAAITVGLIVFFIIIGKYRLKFGTYQYDFRNNGKLDLKSKQDVFVNEIVTHRHIPKQTSSGDSGGSGRSSTHTSSSGKSHGGGGRSF